MSAAELLLWRAYDAQSPLPDTRGDMHVALIASSVYQSQDGKVSLADLLPRWGERKPRSRPLGKVHRSMQTK